MRWTVAVLLGVVCAVAGAQERETRLFPVSHASARDIAALFAPEAVKPPEPGPRSRTLVQSAREALTAAVGEDGEWQAEIHHRMGPPRGVASAGTLATLLPEGLTGPPTADVRGKTLLATGTPEALDRFGEILQMLDKPAREVSLEVAVLQVPPKAAGVDWSMPTGAAEGALPFARSKLGEAVEANGGRGATVRLEVPNGRAAEFEFGEYLPHLVEVGGKLRPRAIVEGLTLSVTPRVNADGSVTLSLRGTQEAGVVTAEAEAGDEAQRLVSKPLETTVRVAAGESVILGGPGLGSLLPAEVAAWLEAHPQGGKRYPLESLIAITPRVMPLHSVALPGGG